ncbi:MAG: 30S ribosomal protein S20 [Magnetovibrio sp.]|nr:30S ribosomal protein S20 [Magnetovibrio sp.]
MANHTSAKKRIRQTIRKTTVNRSRRGSIRTELRTVEEAIASGDKKLAQTAFKTAEPALMVGVSKGIIHKNTATRKLSRLSKRIKAMAA